jgi:four helix bundle protein
LKLRQELEQRLLVFAAHCMKLTGRLSRTVEGRYVSGQLMRSSASAGANYQEACAAESRADFVHKLQIVLKELRESEYWLKLMRCGAIIPESASAPLLTEAEQLVRILAKSVITTKSRSG